MYAVIKTGGKQYRITPGAKLKVEKLPGEVGSNVTLDKVLVMADGDKVTIGAPLIAGVTVPATVISQGRGDKIMIFKFRRRKHYRKTQGHRQSYTEIEIGDFGSGSAKAKVAPVKAEAAPEKVATVKAEAAPAKAKAPVKAKAAPVKAKAASVKAKAAKSAKAAKKE